MAGTVLQIHAGMVDGAGQTDSGGLLRRGIDALPSGGVARMDWARFVVDQFHRCVTIRDDLHQRTVAKTVDGT